MDDDYQYAGKVSEFEQGAIRACAIPGVAVTNVDGQICAVTDYCTHEAVTLTGGYGVVFEKNIICMLHTSVFEVDTGKSIEGPAYDPLGVFDVRVDGEDVYISKTLKNI